MNHPIIEVKNIGKKYNITHEQGRYIALRDVLMNVIKAPFKILKTKVKRVTGFEKKEEYWALKDVSFEVHKGEVVGIIGRNGAGKSTLLKILSQITPPTTGEIKVHGKVGSLLEVGTGFHPELTGRENIFLNGAILGMGRKEIAQKFDQIVEFAGIEKFLDTPVKYYSSGMYVRLAFSVAAHMEPDILIVDEVLAVGDAEFQKKCLGKMDEITKKQGRTILFVSHNMAAIRELCTKTIHIEAGRVKNQGDTAQVIDEYLALGDVSEKTSSDIVFSEDQKKRIQIRRMNLVENRVCINDPFTIEITYEVRESMQSVFIILIFFNHEGARVTDFLETDSQPLALGMRTPGTYTAETFDRQDGLMVHVHEDSHHLYRMQSRASIIPQAEWKTTRL